MAIPLKEQRILCMKSGNRCAFPGCRRILTAEDSPPDRLAVLGEAAHIIAESPAGPRGDFPLSVDERNRYDNLVLLCNVHHQLIDDQPQTYTVERLRAIRDEHEQWVQGRLGPTGDDDRKSELQSRVIEQVYSTVLAVERMPRFVYGVPCVMMDERQVPQCLRPLRGNEMAPFILREGMLFAFQDLKEPNNPFADVVARLPIKRIRVEEWWEDPDRCRWFVDLANRALNKLTGRRGLHLDREHRRYYFPMRNPGEELEVSYRPLNRAHAQRKVVWQPTNQRTGAKRDFWYHHALSLRWLRTGPKAWSLCIRPEFRVTSDGQNSLDPLAIGKKVTRKQSRIFNYDLLGAIQFWRDFLGDSRSRIILPFGGGGQAIVIDTALLEGQVAWPGIPAEHAKPFRNVEYADDLFTSFELMELDADVDDDYVDEEEEDSDDDIDSE